MSDEHSLSRRRLLKQGAAAAGAVVAGTAGPEVPASKESAYAQAPEVTRRRLYIDTLESVLGRAHKVLIDGKAGSNMIYLPIDKLLEKSNAQAGEPQSAEQAAAAANAGAKEADQVTVEARGRGER